MPQHLWENILDFRFCEVCGAGQARDGDRWEPECNPICPGDPDDDDAPPDELGGRTSDLEVA